jgi:acyl CoA:acetate/3-ketoacid CoA transferase beta subunit
MRAAPGVTVEEVRSATGAALMVATPA